MVLYRSYDPLFYALLLPNGDDGWHLGMKTTYGRTLTAQMFYRHHLNIWSNKNNHLLRCGFLTQQYMCDAFVRMEEGRLNYCREHQKELKAASYKTVLDATCEEELAGNARKVILPPSVTGSPRHYAKIYQDAMAIVR